MRIDIGGFTYAGSSFYLWAGRHPGRGSSLSAVSPPHLQRLERLGMEFKDQYRHPNWQKVRLAALESASFSCQRCRDRDSQLHVHHKRYIKGRMIWEYSGSELEVLCDSCHTQAHQEKESLMSLLATIPTSIVPDVYSLIAGYCSCANAGHDISAAKHSGIDPFAFLVGKMAAHAAEKIGNVYELERFIDDLSKIDRRSGGVIEVKISAARSAFSRSAL